MPKWGLKKAISGDFELFNKSASFTTTLCISFCTFYPPSFSFIKEHLAYVRRRRSMQMNLQRGHSDLGGLKTAISEAHLASSNSMYFRAPSPKLSNFMQEFTSERSDFHVSLPARIHAI